MAVGAHSWLHGVVGQVLLCGERSIGRPRICGGQGEGGWRLESVARRPQRRGSNDPDGLGRLPEVSVAWLRQGSQPCRVQGVCRPLAVRAHPGGSRRRASIVLGGCRSLRCAKVVPPTPHCWKCFFGSALGGRDEKPPGTPSWGNCVCPSRSCSRTCGWNRSRTTARSRRLPWRIVPSIGRPPQRHRSAQSCFAIGKPVLASATGASCTSAWPATSPGSWGCPS